MHYTTAKIALVGDSAVGKSGLGYRIVEDRFQITDSTHGQQFWVVDKLGKMRHDGTQCEENYLVTLFDLVLTLYHIPFDDPMVRDLREQLLKEASPLTSRR